VASAERRAPRSAATGGYPVGGVWLLLDGNPGGNGPRDLASRSDPAGGASAPIVPGTPLTRHVANHPLVRHFAAESQ
jgi:hypothetical protein